MDEGAMDDILRELYQQTVLDHGRNPRNEGRVDPATHTALGHNPVCGDRIDLTLAVDGGRIGDIRFKGQGCAISIASTSMMTELVRGRSLAEVRRLEAAFIDMAASGPEAAARHDIDADLEALRLLSGIHAFPMRVKCATLPWRTLEAALAGENGASTEAGMVEKGAMGSEGTSA